MAVCILVPHGLCGLYCRGLRALRRRLFCPVSFIGTGVYSIADVHRLNFSNPVAWDLLYEPYNERAESIQVPCDGTNAGSCRAPTNFAGSDVDQTTCALPLNLSRRSSWPSPSPQVPTSTLPLSTASLTTSSRDLAAASGAAFLNRLIASVSASMAVYWGWV